MSDIEQSLQSVARSLQAPGVDPHGLEVGQYEGLSCIGTARLRPAPGETEKHHSGYLLGHLLRWVNSGGRVIDERVVGLTLYGSAIGHAQAQRLMAKNDGTLGAHLYAAGLCERKRGTELPEQDELQVYAWLCEQAGLEITPDMVERLMRLRTKRHERARHRGQ